MTDKAWLTTAQAAELIGVTAQTMRRWRSEKTGPPFVRVTHRTIRYSQDDLVDWMSRSNRR